MNVKVTSKDFGYSVKFLKKNGYTFDAPTKTWIGLKSVDFLVGEGYVTVERIGNHESRLYDDMMNNPNSVN